MISQHAKQFQQKNLKSIRTSNLNLQRVLQKPQECQMTQIKEGQYQVSKRLSVPEHIKRPEYIIQNQQPNSSMTGKPIVNDQSTVNYIRESAKVVSNTLSYLMKQAKEGVTTDELDKIAHEFIISQGAYPSCLGFMNFPKSITTSVNDVLCHGIPDSRPLQNGDWLNIDLCVYKDGVHGDNAATVLIGDVDPKIQHLIKVTQQAMYEAIKICGPGVPFKRIGEVCHQIAQKYHYNNCELLTGHGIGQKLHQSPIIQHQLNDIPYVMEPGNVFTIEPVFMKMPGPYYMWSDQFTIASPGNASCQWEHMILITENGCEVLTQRDDEKIE